MKDFIMEILECIYKICKPIVYTIIELDIPEFIKYILLISIWIIIPVLFDLVHNCIIKRLFRILKRSIIRSFSK